MPKKFNTKSSILWGSILIATLAVTGFSTAIINNTSAETKNNTTATLTNTDIIKSSANTTDEMVYIITNKSGATDKILANSYTENKLNETAIIDKTNLPVTFNISYQLDGQDISADDLADKSGHVKIKYDFSNHQKYGYYQVPFATVTTAVLDDNFSNVTVTNGRLLDDGTRKVILGLTFPGLNRNFSTNLNLPETFEITADVTNFKLGTTYTIATNQIFSELDTSKLSTIDDLATSMDQLSSATNQLISGSTQLQNGLQQLLDKSGALTSGVNQLNDGLQTLSSKSGELNSGATQVFHALLATAQTQIDDSAQLLTTLGITKPTLTISNYSTSITQLISDFTSDATAARLQYLVQTGTITPEQAATIQANAATAITSLQSAKAQFDSYNQFYTGLQQYTAGVDAAAVGSQQLANNLPTLTNGITALRDGATQLTNGIKLFNQQGISQLVSAANKAENFASDLRATVSASKSYTHYSQPNAQQVTFIYKTPEI